MRKDLGKFEILKIIIDTLKGFKISLVEKDYKYRIVNKGYSEAFGLSEDEIVGKKVSEIMGEDVFEKIIKPNLDSAFNGEIVSYTEWFNFPEKGRRYCDVYYYPLRDEKGEVSNVIVVSHDITDIRESEERYKRLFENVPVGLCVSTPEGKILDCNEQLLKILGYPDKETILKKNARDLYFDPEERKLWIEKMEKDGYLSGYEVSLKKFDGTPVIVRESSRVVRDLEGRILRFEGAIEDISEIVKERESVVRKLFHISLLNKITKDIIEHVEIENIIDSLFKNLFENVQLEFGSVFLYEEENDRIKIFKKFPENPIYEDAFKALETLNLKETMFKKCIERELVWRKDFRKDNIPFHKRLGDMGLVSGVAIPFIVENKLFGILTLFSRKPFSEDDLDLFKDLGEHVSLAMTHLKIYKELEKSYKELQSSQAIRLHEERLKILGQIASGIAHDINNLLSPILGYTELILQRSKLNKKERDYLQIIKTSAEQIFLTVSRLKEFYRREEEEEVIVDIEKVFDEVIEITSPKWKEIPKRKGLVIKIKKEVPPQTPPFLGVKTHLRDSLMNLVLNSVDALPNGGEIVLKAKVSENKLILEVSDNGIGMDEETKARCLEPFYTTKKEGTGLGLSIVNEIVKRYNGKMEIESSVGKGTTVRLTFPVKEVKEKIEKEKVSEKLSSLRVLVVDDDEMVREFIKEFLESEGQRVELAEDGIKAERILSSSFESGKFFDLIITDLGMPGMDGISLAKLIKRRFPSTPVILLTGWTEIENGEKEYVDLTIEKPLNIESFKEALRKVFKSKRRKND